VWYYKIENDGFSMGTNRKPIEGSQIPELLTLFQEVKQGRKPEDNSRSFCIDREQIETLDLKVKERIAAEIREKTAERNLAKIEKKKAELDKKLARERSTLGGPDVKFLIGYAEELAEYSSNLEAQTENEITKAIEKAHTYHFNLQNYRPEEEKQTEFPMVELKELITINNNKIKPANYPKIEFTILGVSKQIGVFVNEKIKGKDIKQSYFDVEKNEFCYNPYRINVGSIGLCELDIENQIISGVYNIFSCDESKLNPKFLEALFKTQKFLDYVNDKATGGVRMDFKIEFMQDWKIPLPPLEMQNEIVEKIEKQKQIIAATQVIIERMRECREIVLDKKCEIIEMSDMFNFEYGITKSASDEGKYRLVRITDINEDGKLNDEIVYCDILRKEDKSILQKGDLVMARTGATFGKVLYFDSDILSVFASYLIRFIPKKSKIVEPKYVYYFCQTQDYWKQANSLADGGTQPQFNSNKIAKVKIPIPSLETQRQIVEKLDRQMAALESVRFLKAEAEKRIEEILEGVWKSRRDDNIIDNEGINNQNNPEGMI